MAFMKSSLEGNLFFFFNSSPNFTKGVMLQNPFKIFLGTATDKISFLSPFPFESQ